MRRSASVAVPAVVALALASAAARALPPCDDACSTPSPLRPGFPSAAGDFDGDGIDDLAVRTAAGYELWFGRAGGLSVSAPDVSLASLSGLLGVTALAAGDLDGDGVDDLVIVVRDWPSGDARVVFGDPAWPASANLDDLLPRTLLITGAPGLNPGGLSGGACTAVGDLNGDGRPDLVIGYPFDNSTFTLEPDRFHLFLGPLAPGTRAISTHDSVVELPTFACSRGGRSSRALAVGDVDRDGIADELIGVLTPGPLGEGLVVVRGRPSIPALVDLQASPPDIALRLPSTTGFGSWAGLADVDGDGLPDLLSSAPFSDTMVVVTEGLPLGEVDLDAPASPTHVVAQSPGDGLFSGLVASSRLLLALERTDRGYSLPLALLAPGTVDIQALGPDACEMAERPLVAGDFDGDGALDVVAATRAGWHPLVSTPPDVTPPSLSVDSAPAELWPPSHRLVTLRLGDNVVVSASDDCSPPVRVRFAGATSSEPGDSRGDGRSSPDVVLVSDTELALRAERSGRGRGRTYVVAVEAADDAGNVAIATFDVLVAHDRRDGPAPRRR